MQKLAVVLNTVCMGLSLALISLPISAVAAMVRESGSPFLRRPVIEYLAPHLLGPIAAFLVAVMLRVFLARRLLIPKWLVIIGAVGAVFSASSLRGGYAHDFSHYICDSCTGYGTIILTISSATAILLALTFVAQTWNHRASQADSFSQ